MRVISKIAISIGLMIAALGACCIDSTGLYGYAAGVICILGGFIAGTGYAVELLVEKRDVKSIGEFHQTDRYDADLIFIEIGIKK